MVEKLKQDMIKAMKDHDKDRLITIRMIKGEIDKEHIDKKREINDELLIEVVNRGIKQRKDSIEEFKKGSRDDLIEKTQSEIDLLMNYLPEQLTEEEVEKIINDIFDEVNPTSQKDMGKLMQAATAKLKGKTDMKEVSSLIRNRLSNL